MTIVEEALDKTLEVAFPVDGRLRLFHEPVEIVEISTEEAIGSGFARLDEALNHGYVIAGYATYEFGALLNGVPYVAAEKPLLAIGIYTSGCSVPSRPTSLRFAPAVALTERREYEEAFAAIKRLLYEGDAYQVNLTASFAFPFAGDAFEAFEALVNHSPMPCAAFVRHGARAFASLSPEVFLSFDGETVRSQPMKGTAPPESPGLLGSDKNRAEHVMIVDLVRNDLHRVCSDVVVEQLFTVESYPTFATMTSTIRGVLHPNRSLLDVFAAAFPCGSITGAPKLAAMRAIAELERRPRGIAMGTIGYLEPGRRGCWNVAIRTIAFDSHSERAELRIGGGVVADSDVSDEWAEILVKRRLFDALSEDLTLIETMRVESRGCAFGPHLARLSESAAAFGIPFSLTAAEQLICRYLEHADTVPASLLRISLRRDGSLSFDLRSLDPAPPSPSVCVSPVRVRSTDPLLRHKTTRRRAYDAAQRFASERGCFEGLLLNERGEIADGSRTTLFVQNDGALRTPPIAAGAFAGLLRAKLIAEGAAIEAPIMPNDVSLAEKIFIGNAARGLIAVRVVPADI